MIYYGNELYHHGIKGQKWGVRNYQNEDGTWTSRGKRHRRIEIESEDYKKAHDGRSYKELSTKELQERNYRLNQENQYRQALLQQRKKSSIKKYVDLFVAGAGTITAIAGAYATYKKFGERTVKAMRNNGTLRYLMKGEKALFD